MIVLLARHAFSNVISLNSSNYKQYIGGKDPVFVKFYSQYCAECNAMAEDFSEAAKAMETVRFAELNCPENEAICKELNVKKYPEIRLYFSESKKSMEYHGKRVYEDFLDFIEQKTDLVANRQSQSSSQLNSEEIEQHIFSNNCSMTFFYVPWSKEAKDIKPNFQQSQQVFKNDDNISFTIIDCETHKSLCTKHNIASYPTIKLYKPYEQKARVYKYENRDVKGIVHFVNTFCQANRLTSGLLNGKAGIIEGTDEVIAKFFSAQDRSEIIPEMEKIPGTETYQAFMNRIIANGDYIMNEDLKTLDHILDHSAVSGKGLDYIKIKRNILCQFMNNTEEGYIDESETEYKEVDSTQKDEPLNLDDFNITLAPNNSEMKTEDFPEFEFRERHHDPHFIHQRDHIYDNNEQDLLFYAAHEL